MVGRGLLSAVARTFFQDYAGGSAHAESEGCRVRQRGVIGVAIGTLCAVLLSRAWRVSGSPHGGTAGAVAESAG
jgi:hypothetical protein